MKAILVDTTQPDRPLRWAETADPACAADEVLVEVRATALNRADLAQRAGNYPPPPGASEIIGLEMAGVINRLGQNVKDWHIGDRVCALLPGGGYAGPGMATNAYLAVSTTSPNPSISHETLDTSDVRGIVRAHDLGRCPNRPRRHRSEYRGDRYQWQ